jgi:hypothetical protein
MNSSEFKKLYVKDGRILPNKVSVIDGSLFLDSNKITKIENLPNTINGDLDLENNNITKI